MGSVFKNKKSWVGAVHVTENGVRRRVQKGGFNTKTEAKEWVTQTENDKNKGVIVRKSGTFLDEYISWYKIFKEPDIQLKTKGWYKLVIKLIAQYIGQKKLSEITSKDIQIMLNDYGKTHVNSSVRRVKSLIKAFVNFAMDEDMLNKDITRNVKVISKAKSKKSEDKFLERDEFIELINSAKEYEDTTSKMVLTAAFTGMRYAEIAALTPQDVDLEKGTIDINNSWEELGKVFKKTKNESSVRIISIPTEFIEIMKSWDFGDKFIFQGENGFPPTDQACNKKLHTILKHNNSKMVTFHALRHSHASYLLSQDVSIQYVSERLGHASTQITLDTYSHFLNESRIKENEKALDKLNNL